MSGFYFVSDRRRGVTHLLAHIGDGGGRRLLCWPGAVVCVSCITAAPDLPLCLACSIVDEATADPSESHQVAR